MKKLIVILILGLVITGCGHVETYAGNNAATIKKYAKTEVILSDISKKITGYYYLTGIPSDFNGKQFIEFLDKHYPDKAAVELIESYKIHARAIGNGYSVMLCDQNGRKIMEDFSCTLDKVDVRYWDKEEFHPCQFEDNWQQFCK